MKIGILYEPAYGLFLEQLICDLEYELRLVGGESRRLTAADIDQADVDLIYVLPCEEMATLKQIETDQRIINSTRAQETAIDKIATSQRLIDNHLPTPETIISQRPHPLVHLLEQRGIALLKSANLCGGVGHRVLRYEGGRITTHIRGQKYQVVFGERPQIRERAIVLAPPYYAQEFIHTTAQANDRVYRVYIVGKEVVMGTVRVKAGVRTPEESIINVATGARYQFIQCLDDEMASLALRVADLIGFEVGVVDFLQDAAGRPLIIEADCDGCYLVICRKFQDVPGYGDVYNFNAQIARRLGAIAAGDSHR